MNEPRTVLAIVGWEEGLAGQVTGWMEKCWHYDVKLYVNFSDSPLEINQEAAKHRPASQFDIPTSNSYKGIELINSTIFARELINRGITHVAITLSNSDERQQCLEYIKRHPSLTVVNCIHPSAVILDDVLLGEGLIIEPQCYVGYRAEIGNGVHLHAGAQVDHHSVIKDYATLNPGAIIAGNALIGSHAVIHTNATIINRIEIAPRNIVAAGAVVINNWVESPCILMGVPAKPRPGQTGQS